jgi:hypothetical protein
MICSTIVVLPSARHDPGVFPLAMRPCRRILADGTIAPPARKNSLR